MSPFTLRSVPAGGDCAILRVAGEVDVHTAPELREEVAELVGRGAVHLVVDLRGVGFLDSTGLGALVAALKRVHAERGSLRLVIDSVRLLRILRITGLSKVFTVHPTAEDALSADPRWSAALRAHGSTPAAWCAEHDLR